MTDPDPDGPNPSFRPRSRSTATGASTVELDVAGLSYFTRAAFADLGGDLVGAEGATGLVPEPWGLPAEAY